jgi:hypothetical protein
MEKKYICQFCEKKYSSYQSKFNHITKFHKDIKNNNISLTNNKINPINPIINKEFKCTYCNKEFTLKSSLIRHQKTRCKTKNEFVNKIINEKKQPVNIIINNNITNNTINSNNKTQNNININPYNKPNMNNFELLDICNIFEHEFNIVLKLIEITYFNKNIEENHCFNVSNLQGEYVNTISETKLKKYFFDELFGVILNRVKLLYKKYKKKLFEIPKQLEIQEKIQALQDMRNDNSNNYKSYLKLINVLAYDNKDLIINTWQKLKQIESFDTNNNDEIIWDRNIDVT